MLMLCNLKRLCFKMFLCPTGVPSGPSLLFERHLKEAYCEKAYFQVVYIGWCGNLCLGMLGVSSNEQGWNRGLATYSKTQAKLSRSLSPSLAHSLYLSFYLFLCLYNCISMCIHIYVYYICLCIHIYI